LQLNLHTLNTDDYGRW